MATRLTLWESKVIEAAKVYAYSYTSENRHRLMDAAKKYKKLVPKPKEPSKA